MRVFPGRANVLTRVPALSVAEPKTSEYAGGGAVGDEPEGDPDEPVGSRPKGRHLA